MSGDGLIFTYLLPTDNQPQFKKYFKRNRENYPHRLNIEMSWILN